MNGGYSTRVCHVNLTNRNIETRELDIEISRKFIGDVGINLKLAYDLMKPGIDPLSPDNLIIIGAGPLAGTRIQAPRWTAVTKYPLTGAIAFASGGMGFGIRLKRAGYDHLVVSGRASTPVYLKVSDEKLEICDAGNLWGKDIFDTTETLWQEHGKQYSVVSIGQAGENLVKLALCLVDKQSSLGKGGMAAVMGSKNLKAIAVKGTGRVRLGDPPRFKSFADGMLRRYSDYPGLKRWVELGKLSLATLGISILHKNFTELYPQEEYQKLYSNDIYLSRIKYKREGCTTCSFPCKDVLKIRQGEYEGLTTTVSSLIGRIWNLFVQCGAGSFENGVKLIDVANRYGVDTHTFAPAMMLAVELYERGIITEKDTEGLALRSDFQTALSLLEKVAFRRGIGDVLADGSPGVIKKFGEDCERYSVYIKGLDQQLDARTLDFDMAALSQVTQPEGGSCEPAAAGMWYPRKRGFSLDTVRSYCQRMALSREATERVFDVPSGFNAARLTKVGEDFYIVLTSLGICDYRSEFWDWDKLAEVYSSVTCIEMTGSDMREAAERIWNMFKALNVREGFDRKDDRFPARWLEPLHSSDGQEIPLMTCGGGAVTAAVLERLLDEYYEERGWDISNGTPTSEKLMALGLADVAADLQHPGDR